MTRVLSVALLLVTVHAPACVRAGTLSAALKVRAAMSQTGVAKATTGDSHVSVVLQGAPEDLRHAMSDAGGFIGSLEHDIATGFVSHRGLQRLADHPATVRVEEVPAIRFANSATTWEAGAAGVRELVPHAGTGEGVIVGFLDTGIDWRHPDFRGPGDQGRSRILRIWDTSDDRGPAPQGFAYGTEWTREQIEGALAGDGPGPPRDLLTPPAGHGTYVAGIACGNGSVDPRHTGVAPDADIVMVVLSPSRPTSLLDAVRYVSAVAGEREQPAVFNFSGFLTASAYDVQRSGIERLLRVTPGRVLVASAGNGGEGRSHARFALGSTERFTVYRAASEGDGTHLLWLTGFLRGASDAQVGLGLTPEDMIWRSVADLASQPGAMGDEVLLGGLFTARDSVVAVGHDSLAGILWGAHIADDGIWLSILVEDRFPAAPTWYVKSRGDRGILHTWSADPQGDPPREVVTDPLFVPLDNRYTVQVSASSAEVLAVGAYANQVLPAPYDTVRIGELLPFSARGPSLKETLKPDLTAPGVITSTISGDPPQYRTTAGTSSSAAVQVVATGVYYCQLVRGQQRVARRLMLVR